VNAACPKVSNCWRVLGIIVLFVRGNYRESSSNGVERINRSFLSAKDIVRCRAAVAGNRSQTIMTAVEARVRQTLARKRKGAKPRLTRCRMRHIFSGRMLVNNSIRVDLGLSTRLTSIARRCPPPVTKMTGVDAEFGAASPEDACLTSRLIALAWRRANTPDRSFSCALDAAQRDAACRLFDMTRSMQTAPSHLTSSIPCRAGAGDNCHSQELLGR
jgi:hypothetical protein